MAITASLIGRLGGSDVTIEPVEGQQDGTAWATIWSVDVPAGQTWLIVVAGEMTSSLSHSPGGYRLGGIEIQSPTGGTTPASVAHTATGPVNVSFDIRAPTSRSSTSFTGHAYTVPLPD